MEPPSHHTYEHTLKEYRIGVWGSALLVFLKQDFSVYQAADDADMVLEAFDKRFPIPPASEPADAPA